MQNLFAKTVLLLLTKNQFSIKNNKKYIITNTILHNNIEINRFSYTEYVDGTEKTYKRILVFQPPPVLVIHIDRYEMVC